MRVTEQIDALTTLSTNPFKYLVAPRLIAGVLTLPVLVLVADIIGVLGGYLVGVYKLDFNDGAYIRNTIDFLQFQDVFSGLVKAAVFGFLITLMGCYHGYNSRGGAQGVGGQHPGAGCARPRRRRPASDESWRPVGGGRGRPFRSVHGDRRCGGAMTGGRGRGNADHFGLLAIELRNRPTDPRHGPDHLRPDDRPGRGRRSGAQGCGSRGAIR